MREAYANVGAEEGVRAAHAFGSDTPPGRVADAFSQLVTHPPWMWLEHARGLVPWLATAAAADEAQRRGMALWGAGPDVVRYVHDKAFAAHVARTIDPHAELTVVLGDQDVTSRRIVDAVARWPAWARARFTVKPRWGTSGRGRLPGIDGRIVGVTDLDRPIRSLQERGGAVVEPWFARMLDLSSQWVIHDEGRFELLGVTQQVTRSSGVYLGCTFTRDLSATTFASGTRWDGAVVARARHAVAAAAAAGYRGPCGVDAFVYEVPEGDQVGDGSILRGIVEFNARFTAGFVAFALAAQHGLRPGQRATCRFDREVMLTVTDGPEHDDPACAVPQP